MKIGVIGAAGFLGKELCASLSSTDRDVIKFDIRYDSDRRNEKYMDVVSLSSNADLDGCDVLINLAAEHRDDVKPQSKYYETNVRGAENICHAASLAGVKQIIFTSSVAIFGFAPPDTAEDGVKNFFNEYGRTKLLAEEVYKKWQEQDPMNRSVIIVRPTVIFGPGNRGNVYNLMKQIASGRFLMVGNGLNVKSMAYVGNVAEFIVHTMGLNSGLHIFNYVDKPDMNMNQLVAGIREKLLNKKGVGPRLPKFFALCVGYFCDMVSLISRKPLPLSSVRVRKFTGTTSFSSAAASTGFLAPVSLEEAIAETLECEFMDK